ncbi:hypothetical protein GHT06_013537 [Daphnia sinensis]|uniref:Uncharacterized protein n=1 Tax=Daphnia sinensis TaxID=1820382 RepID=A0AAD5KS57_9CRUS|nr:hypothetical protein GHT06_013537 [Daphnia sinensis]
MHTCRMCDSPTHVLANFPKQPRSLTTPSTISKGPMGTRSYSSVLTNRGTDKTNRKAQEAEPIGGGQMPIAPIGDAVSFPELAQRPKMSTVVLNKAPEDPISKPVEAESLSDTDSNAEDTSCVDSRGNSVTNKNNKKKDSSIQPGQRSFDRRDANHVSETQESLGVPLGTPPTTITDKTLKAMEAVRRKKGHEKRPNPLLNPIFNFNHD